MVWASLHKQLYVRARFLRRDIRKDSAQIFFWLPIFLGLGIALYFALPREPALWHGGVRILILAGFLALVYAVKKRADFLLLMVVAGFLLMQMRAHQLEAPVWRGGEEPRWIHGTVERVEALPKGYRLLLGQVDVWKVPLEETPKYIRLKVHKVPEEIVPGRRVAIRAALKAPARPAYPGGFDFSRWAYFKEIGAVGFSLMSPRCLNCDTPRTTELLEKESAIEAPARSVRQQVFAQIEKIRQTVYQRIRAAAKEKYAAEGGVASALIAGLQGNIPKAEMEALRISGLGHLLSISGLHMVMVTMAVFYSFRRMLALFPRIVLYHNTKKIAAVLALLVGAFYLLLAGMPVSAQRAFVMIALFFFALLLDRVGMTLRPLTWAALIVLCITPEALLGPSFQMSFAATFALIVTFRKVVDSHVLGKKKNIFLRLGVYIASLLISSVVAGLATLPFALYHFGRIAVYSVLANLCAVPLASFIIMPAGMISLALMPFHLEALPMAVMLKALELLLYIAAFCASLPAAAISLPQPPLPALIALVMGAFGAVLLRSYLRRMGVVCFAIGAVWMFFPSAGPDLLVHEGGKLFAIKNAEGKYYFSSLQYARLARSEWAEALGEDAPQKLYGKKISQEKAAPWECSEAGCLLRAKDYYTVLLLQDGGDIPCASVDVVVQMGALPASCTGKKYTLGMEQLNKEGTHTFWLRSGDWEVQTVAQERGRRLWTRKQNRPKKADGNIPPVSADET